jgi:predicted porin
MLTLYISVYSDSGCIQRGRGTTMKKIAWSAAASAALVVLSAGAANAADMDNMVTKAPPPPAIAPASCGSFYDFFLTACPLTWSGVTFYGTVDMGVTYATHGVPFDPNHPTGELYLVGAGGTVADNRISGFFPGENAMSQSNVGVKIIEPLAPGGWSFVAQGELAFNPYSGLLANAPAAEFNAIGVPQNQWEVPFDSSRWGWLAAQNYAGVSSPTWGTLTFGRQNTPETDAITAYDPMGAAYAFSLIGYSGKTAGAGDTEDARWTTAIKYRISVPTTFGSVRAVVMGQPIGGSTGGYNAYNPNNGAVSGGIGGDVKGFGPGVLSMDVFGTWEKDAVNWQLTGISADYVNGVPLTTFPANTYLKATLSNNTAFMAVAKYTFGSWGNPAPVVGKAPAPSGPSGIPLTLYAGYEWIQFTNPSDPQTSSFFDDGYQLFYNGAAASTGVGSPNGTAIANNAFNASCGSGAGCTNEIFQVMWTGAKYGITRDLDFIGAYYHYIQNQFVIASSAATCANNGAANSRCYGWYDTYSMVLDWRFLPKWDAYIGVTYSAAFGGIAFGDITTNNLATTAGVRFRF